MLQQTLPSECQVEQENYLVCSPSLEIKQISFDGAWVPLITGKNYRKNATMVKVLPSLAERDIYITQQYSQISRVEVKVGWENGTQIEGILKGTQLKVIGDYNLTYRNSMIVELTFIIPGRVDNTLLLSFLPISPPTPVLESPSPFRLREGVQITQQVSWGSLALNQSDDVTIPSGVETAFENTYSIVYRVIRIFGSLKIVQDGAHLRAQYLVVMPGGSLWVQGENTQITLVKSVSQVQDLPHGGGMLINNGGTVVMAGRDMGNTRARLKKRVQPGDPVAFIDAGLSWQHNFLLAFSSTTMNYWETELAFVNFYGETTGLLDLKKAFQYYYWGTSNLTSFNSTGVDMRGEVILLTRSIKLSLCQLSLTGNSSTNITNVEISGTSCHFFEPIIKISGLFGQFHMIGSSLRMEDTRREGSGIEISNFSNTGAEIRICQNKLYGPFTGTGILVKASANITIIENLLFNVRPYDSKYSIGLAVLQRSSMIIQGNIIGSIAGPAEVVAGYQIIGADCDQQPLFSGNVAHSIGGHGLIVKSLSHQKCILASEFTAYKCQGAGVWVREPVFEVRLINLTLIDNGFGVAPQVGLVGTTALKVLKIQQSKFFGDTDAIECFSRPQVCQQNPGAPQCHERSAIMVGDTNEVQVETFYEDVQFIGYSKNTTKCSYKQAIFTQSPEASTSGFYPEVKITNATFLNANQEAWTRFPPNSTILLSFDGSSDTSFQLTSLFSPATSNSSFCQPLLPSTSTPLLCRSSTHRLTFLSLTTTTATSMPLHLLITLPPTPAIIQPLSYPLSFALRPSQHSPLITYYYLDQLFDPHVWDHTCTHHLDTDWNASSEEEGCQVWVGSRVHIRVRLGGGREGRGSNASNMTQVIRRHAKVAMKEGQRVRVRKRVEDEEVVVSVGIESGEVYRPDEIQRPLEIVYETLDQLFQTPDLFLEDFNSKLVLGAVIYQTTSLDRTIEIYNETAQRTRKSYGVWADKGTLPIVVGQGNQTKQETEQFSSSNESSTGKNSTSLPTTSQRAQNDYQGLTILLSVLLSVILLLVISTIAYFGYNYLKKMRKLRYKTEQAAVRTKGILKTPSSSPQGVQLDFDAQGANRPQLGESLSTQKEEIELSAMSSAPLPPVESSRELISQSQQSEAKSSIKRIQEIQEETFAVQQMKKRKKKKVKIQK